MSEIHILRSPENGVVLAHGHDESGHAFLEHLVEANWTNEADIWENQAVFPLGRADELVAMAKFEGLGVLDSPQCSD